MMKSYNVAVYGVTGHTGRFVASELRRRGIGVRGIARRPPTESSSHENGEQFSWVRASCDDPEALDRALAGTDAVINCAGPFLETAPDVIEAALRVGAHYLDVSAEQRSVRQSLATYGEEATARGLVVLPAMAFYGGLADLLASQLCTGLRTVEEILIGIALDYWHPTAGTRRTGERNTARRMIVSGGRLSPLPAVPSRRHWQFPHPFGNQPVTAVPLSEVITISRHIAANRIESFINDAPLHDLMRPDTPPPTAVEANGRSSQSFVMDVVASGDGASRRIAAFGRDIYAVSASLIVEACVRVLSQEPCQGGSFAPAQLFDPADFLAALGPEIHFSCDMSLDIAMNGMNFPGSAS
jgi:short subunit dehydrogenase-like uncharacterized protein